jgi:fatty acid synthase subunit beta
VIHLQLKHAETGAALMQATGEVQQPPTALFFTGQGSAAVGMGMDLYSSSPAARAVWDAAEQYFVQKYGFSMYVHHSCFLISI